MNAPARNGSAEVSSAEAVLETCKQNDYCQLLPWIAVEIPLPLSEAQWEWRIHVTKKGKTVSISGQYQRGIHLSVDPKLSKKQALEHVKAGHHKGTAKLVIYPKDNGILAYKCPIKDDYNHIFVYTYIDAYTGKQIAKQQVQYNL